MFQKLGREECKSHLDWGLKKSLWLLQSPPHSLPTPAVASTAAAWCPCTWQVLLLPEHRLCRGAGGDSGTPKLVPGWQWGAPLTHPQLSYWVSDTSYQRLATFSCSGPEQATVPTVIQQRLPSVETLAAHL